MVFSGDQRLVAAVGGGAGEIGEAIWDHRDYVAGSCTEGVGVESSVEARSARRSGRHVAEFPLLLSTLNSNGRPRYALVKERSKGRLRIAMMRIGGPEFFRTRGGDGALRMELVADDHDDQES